MSGLPKKVGTRSHIGRKSRNGRLPEIRRITSSSGIPRMTSMYVIAAARMGSIGRPGVARSSAKTSPQMSARAALTSDSWIVSQNPSNTKLKLSLMMSRSKYWWKKTSIRASLVGSISQK
jgi:hypothetical protein